MAAAPVQQSPKKRLRAVPDDALIFREYSHQLMVKGEWGAYSRTARACKCSHEHVRNVVARHLAKPARTDANVHDGSLAYEPAPGEVELAAQRNEAAFLRQLLVSEFPTEQFDVMSSTSSLATAAEHELATFERQVAVPAAILMCNADRDRSRANFQTARRVLLVGCIGLTLMTILAAHSSLWLALALYPEMLGMWYVLGEFRKVVY